MVWWIYFYIIAFKPVLSLGAKQIECVMTWMKCEFFHGEVTKTGWFLQFDTNVDTNET